MLFTMFFLDNYLKVEKMRKVYIILILALTLAGNIRLYSQDAPLYNLYTVEPVMLNPAVVGTGNNPVVFVDYLNQWAGVHDSPEMFSGAFHSLITEKMGAGLNFTSYNSSVFSTFTVSLNYAYVLKLSETQKIIPGVFFGIRQTSISTQGMTGDEMSDPAIVSSDYFGKVFFSTGFGLRYTSPHLTVDFAIPNLYTGDDNKLFRSIMAYAAYDFYTNDDKWKIQPSLLYRYREPETSVLDIGFMVEYQKAVWAQAAYRTNKDLNFMVGFNIKGIGIAYNYTVTNSGMESLSNGSHEVAIRYAIPYNIVKDKE